MARHTEEENDEIVQVSSESRQDMEREVELTELDETESAGLSKSPQSIPPPQKRGKIMGEKLDAKGDTAVAGEERAGGAQNEEMSFHRELLRRTGATPRATGTASNGAEALEGVGSENDTNSDGKDLPGTK